MSESLLIAKMRVDFKIAAPWLAQQEGWTEADLAELNDAIKKAKDDDEQLALWAAWLQSYVDLAKWAAQCCRDAEARIKSNVERKAA